MNSYIISLCFLGSIERFENSFLLNIKCLENKFSKIGKSTLNGGEFTSLTSLIGNIIPKNNPPDFNK